MFVRKELHFGPQVRRVLEAINGIAVGTPCAGYFFVTSTSHKQVRRPRVGFGRFQID